MDAVESMAYTNQVPWHGLGTYIENAPSVDEMIEKADLDWEVHKTPIYLENTDIAIPDHYALVRDKDQKVFDICGNIYTPCQNRQAFEFFVDFIEEGGATMETAGSLQGGKYVWGLANLQAGFKVSSGDEVNGYLLVVCPHQVGKAMIFKFTPIRVVCWNTLSLALRQSSGNEFRMSHRSEFDQSAIIRAKDALGIARDQVGELEKNAKILKKQKLSDNDFTTKVLAPIFQPKADLELLKTDFDTAASPKMKQIMDAYTQAPGADPGNAWGALNAVTYFTDHLASRTTDKRLTNAWLGKTSNQKNRVLDTLLEMAA
jgi:phage/plasmid-like protein (TIGR03299 family)